MSPKRTPGKGAACGLMIRAFRRVWKASPSGCHFHTKWERHERKVVGWHDDSADFKCKELLGPIMNVWSNGHAHRQMHTQIVHTQVIKVRTSCVSPKNNPLFFLNLSGTPQHITRRKDPYLCSKVLCILSSCKCKNADSVKLSFLPEKIVYMT